MFGRKRNKPVQTCEINNDPIRDKKRTPKEAIMEHGNWLRSELGFSPTNDAAEIGGIVLTTIAMDVLQTEGKLVHPAYMSLREAVGGFAFTCFLAVPVITALNDEDIHKDPNRFLMQLVLSVFQFFEEDDQISIFRLGTNIFSKAASSGGGSESFKDFTDQIEKLVLIFALTQNREIIGALRNRYQAFVKLIER